MSSTSSSFSSTPLQFRDLVTDQHLREYETRGYTIIPNVLSPTVCEEVAEAIEHHVWDITIHRGIPHEYCPSREQKNSLLTEKSLRAKVARQVMQDKGVQPGEKGWFNPDSLVWLDGNTRRPIWSKNNGIAPLCMIPEVQQHITFNPDVVEIVQRLYWEIYEVRDPVGYARGPERVGMKVKGSTAMPRHCDYNLWTDNLAVNPNPDRVQAFVNLRVPDGPVGKSGTIQLIPHFHLYLGVIRRFFQYHSDLLTSAEKSTTRMPLDWGKGLESSLPRLNRLLEALSESAGKNYLELREDWVLEGEGNLTQLYGDLCQDLPSIFHPLEWTPVRLRPGEMICWDQRLPHGSLPNSQTVSRIVAYVSLFPFLTEKTRWEARIRAREGRYFSKSQDRGVELHKEVLRLLPNHGGGCRVNPGGKENWTYLPESLPEGDRWLKLEDYRNWCARLQGFDTAEEVYEGI